MKRYIALPWFLYAIIISIAAQAQPAEKLVKVIVAPDHNNWTYKPGEKVQFTISVLQNGNPVKDVKVRYEIGAEKMPGKKNSEVSTTHGWPASAGEAITVSTSLVDFTRLYKQNADSTKLRKNG